MAVYDETEVYAMNPVVLYALTLKDANGNIVEGEKMDSSSNVPNSSNKHSTSGNVHFDTAATSHELNPSS